jgi:decaprenylphospho-beta-D-ribofuranose 2-oxidase
MSDGGATGGGADADPPLETLRGFGRAVVAEGLVLRPRTREEVVAAFARARREKRSIALRGAGRSYGDASLPADGLVADLCDMNRILRFDEATGVVDAEPGATIEDLWRLGVPKGFWPPVVSGTMFPTLGGALAANIHGKNSFAVGTIGEHVEGFELVAPDGSVLWCDRESEPEIFRSAIGGFGLLGCFTRIRLKLKRIDGGRLKVTVFAEPNLRSILERFEREKPTADYLVGWLDAFGKGEAIGRGVVHRGDDAGPTIDPEASNFLRAYAQEPSPRLFGVVPRRFGRHLLAPFVNDVGMRVVNATKYAAARVEATGRPKFQTRVTFAFLLDYVPDWIAAYGKGGLVQYQSFVPTPAAERTHAALIEAAATAGLPPYLLVYKAHRRDPYVLTHAVDGYSMAMDFRVRPSTRERLFDLLRSFDDRVVGAGGRFYLAKDATLRRASFTASVPLEELRSFARLKRRLDPENLLATKLSRRLFDFEAVLEGSSS